MTKSQESRWKLEAEIIKELGNDFSIRQLHRELLKRGCQVAFETVRRDMDKDIKSLTDDKFHAEKEGILAMLEEELSIAHSLATTSMDEKIKLKAMRVVSVLSKTKSDVLATFKQAEIELNKSKRPEYHVSIGKPNEADVEELRKKLGVEDAGEDKEKDKKESSNEKKGFRTINRDT